jgi:hypothetical protein
MDEKAMWTQLVETRRAEAMALFTTAHGYNARNDQLVALGVTVIGAAAALGLKEHFDEVLLGVPAALLLLMIYATQVDADIRVMAAARLRLEQALEGQLGGPALIYQSRAAKFRQGDYVRGIMRVRLVLFLATAGTAIAGADVAEDKGALALILFLVLLGALSLCLRRALADKGRAESDSTKALKDWARPSH